MTLDLYSDRDKANISVYLKQNQRNSEIMKILRRSLTASLFPNPERWLCAASFAAGFDSLHHEHCTLPLQLIEFYGGAAGTEPE